MILIFDAQTHLLSASDSLRKALTICCGMFFSQRNALPHFFSNLFYRLIVHGITLFRMRNEAKPKQFQIFSKYLFFGMLVMR